jgi:DNA-binding NarL/FixJ family response regulator
VIDENGQLHDLVSAVLIKSEYNLIIASRSKDTLDKALAVDHDLRRLVNHAETPGLVIKFYKQTADNFPVSAWLSATIADGEPASAPAPAESSQALTKRELEVLKLIAAGLSTKQAAARLGIAFKTAVGHRTRLMEKLRIHDSATLVRYAIRAGLIDA